MTVVFASSLVAAEGHSPPPFAHLIMLGVIVIGGLAVLAVNLVRKRRDEASGQRSAAADAQRTARPLQRPDTAAVSRLDTQEPRTTDAETAADPKQGGKEVKKH